ncbi:hypothetical protein MKW92_009058 [Papaver armeniacum]|nr:hypothetical protein MKW92_009058 [Papaver armeniacum]
MWKQMHVFDSLYIMSRESSSLLKEAEDKSDICSTTVNDELHKILGIIKGKKFMNARQSMGSFCGCTWNLEEFPAAECSRVYLAPKSMKQLLRSSFKILDQLRSVLQGQIVGKSSVAEKLIGKSSVTEKLIGCFYDVLSKGNLIEKEYFDGIEHRKQLLKDTGSLFDTEVVSEIEFAKSVTKTSEQIDETVQKLFSLRGSILSEDSPHKNITLWRVLYESSLVNIQLDLIRENLDGTIKLGVDLLKHARLEDSADLCQLHASIVKLIASCNGVLLDFLAVQKAVSEVIHMVAEVFVPRCTRKAAVEMRCSSTGIKTSDEQDLDFSLKKDADICDDVPTGEDDDVDICDDVPTGEDDEYDWDDPDVIYVMSRRVPIKFDDEEFD